MQFPFHPSTELLIKLKLQSEILILSTPPHFWWHLTEHVAWPVVPRAHLLCWRIWVVFSCRAELMDKFCSSLEGRVLSSRKKFCKTSCERGIVLTCLWLGPEIVRSCMFYKPKVFLNFSLNSSYCWTGCAFSFLIWSELGSCSFLVFRGLQVCFLRFQGLFQLFWVGSFEHNAESTGKWWHLKSESPIMAVGWEHLENIFLKEISCLGSVPIPVEVSGTAETAVRHFGPSPASGRQHNIRLSWWLKTS